jgi:hypothetical protein
MDADYGFEEESIRKFPCFRTELSNSQGSMKGVLDFAFIALLHPWQHRVEIAGREGLLRGFDNGSIQRVTVGGDMWPVQQ